MNPLIALLGALPVLYILKRLASSARSGSASLPPGPPGWPILRNLFDWPSSTWRVTTSKWFNLYGDIIHLSVGGVPMVVVNSVDIAADMMQGKGAIYSDRPLMPFLGDMVGWRNTTVLSNDGPEFKEHRRLFAHALGTKAALARFEPIVETHTRSFLRRLLDEPTYDKILNNIRRLSATVILDLTYGYEVKTDNDEFIALAERVLDDFVKNGLPGASMIDTFPWLAKLPKWLPGTGFHERAAELRRTWMYFVNTPFERVRQQLADKTARPSYITEHIENRELTPEKEAAVKWTAANMYAAGTDTTVAMIYSAVLFMTLYPEVQAKAQAELDAVVGTHRLPTISDRQDLPYLNAVIKEIFRCAQIVDQSLPHLVRTDDVHEGYFIPKGSLVIANLWFMANDERKYKDPKVFNPERFLGDKPELDPREFVFGFGRRICPGRFFGENNIYLALAMFIATFNISKALDPQGKEITPVIEEKTDFAAIPDVFPCIIKVRSEKAAALIRMEADS